MLGYLTNWFLVRPSPSANTGDAASNRDPTKLPRHPLPISTTNLSSSDYVLYGNLQLSDEAKKLPLLVAKNNLPVRISSLASWCIDRSKSGRGIWIQGQRGWYKLKEPDRTVIEIGRITVRCPSLDAADDNGSEKANLRATLPSQSQLHLTLRAQFGLLSNLLDLLSEPYNNNSNNYVPVHARRSPANIHALLSPNDETFQKFNSEEEPLNREPFDLELLERCPGFVREQLLNYHPLLHEGCAFMKRLSAMSSSSGAGRNIDEGSNESAALVLDGEDASQSASSFVPNRKQKRRWAAADYRRSALEAEARGQRTPWGDLIPNAKAIKPNRLIDIEIRNAARGAAMSYKSVHEKRNSEAAKKRNEMEEASRKRSEEKSVKQKKVASLPASEIVDYADKNNGRAR